MCRPMGEEGEGMTRNSDGPRIHHEKGQMERESKET